MLVYGEKLKERLWRRSYYVEGLSSARYGRLHCLYGARWQPTAYNFVEVPR
jgi:hypothetical protein